MKRKRATPEQKAKRQAERDRKRAEAEARRIAQAKADAEWQERADEAISPLAQRVPVLAADGTVLRSARVQRNGSTFVRSTPLLHLVSRSGERPTITGQHMSAAKRLADAWDIAGGGVGIGASDYGGRTGAGGNGGPQDGGMIWQQIEAQREIEGAAAFLGALWPCVRAVVLVGMDVTAFAATASLRREVALGYLRAALDRLVEFYAALDDKPRAIRAAVVVRALADTQPVDSDAAL